MLGQLSNYISYHPLLPKFANRGNPILIASINNVSIGNSLIDLGSTINMMSMTTLQVLQLNNMLRPTPKVLELANKSIVKPVGALDDIIVTVASLEYPMEFLVNQTKDPTKEHSIILG